MSEFIDGVIKNFPAQSNDELPISKFVFFQEPQDILQFIPYLFLSKTEVRSEEALKKLKGMYTVQLFMGVGLTWGLGFFDYEGFHDSLLHYMYVPSFYCIGEESDTSYVTVSGVPNNKFEYDIYTDTFNVSEDNTVTRTKHTKSDSVGFGGFALITKVANYVYYG